MEGIDSAANMGIAYLYRDEQNNYIPYLQGIDFQNPNYRGTGRNSALPRLGVFQ